MDPAGNKYRFIRRSWFNLLSPVKTATDEPAILIRDPYEALYSVLTQRSSPRGPEDPYSGIAVIGQPGIGQWHCVSLEDCLMVMCRQVAVSAVCAPSPPVRKKAYRVSVRAGHHLDFRGRRGPKAYSILGGLWTQSPARRLGLCDSNASLKIPSAFMMRSDVFTIQATPPQQDRYAQWIKEKKGLRYHMEVFSEQEIKQLGYAVDSSFSFVI